MKVFTNSYEGRGLIILILTIMYTNAWSQYTYQSGIGTMGAASSQMYAPNSVAVAASGDIYVVDAGNNRVQKYNSNNGFVTQWGGPGNNSGMFNYPSGIALDAQENVYVVDQNNHRIQKFNKDGTHLLSFGSMGSTNGNFYAPVAISVDASGFIYVADAGNNRIQKFSNVSPHSHIQSFTNSLNYPTGLTVDGNGNIYVADQNNNRIQVFSNTFSPLFSFGTAGNSHGQFNSPTSVTIDASGLVYVMDSGNDRIEVFRIVNNTAEYLNTIGGYGIDTGKFNYATEVIWRSNKLYVADQNNHRVQIFAQFAQQCTACSDQGYEFSHSWGLEGTGQTDFNQPAEIAIDRIGNVYVCDRYNHKIKKFSNDGTFIREWGGYGTSTGLFNQPIGITIDGSGNVYVADNGNARIQKFDNHGAFLLSWGSYGPNKGDYEFAGLNELAVDQSGNIYAVDWYQVKVYTPNGIFIRKWDIPSAMSDNGKVYNGLTIDADNNVYVSITTLDVIKKYTYTGTWIQDLSSSGSGDGQVNGPGTLAIDANGILYFPEIYNNRVQKLTGTGGFVAKWGGPGTLNGQFNEPRGIAIDLACNVYIADTKNHRIQVFKPMASLPTIASFSPSSGNGGTRVVMTGTNLSGVTSVSFNGTIAPLFEVNSSTQITAVVPVGATTGPVSVTKCIGSMSNSNFVVEACVGGPSYSHSFNIGSQGTDPGEFEFEGVNSYIGIDAGGNIYVAENRTDGTDRIQKFSNSGAYLTGWSSGPTSGIAADPDGNVYVCRSDLNQVKKYTSTGSPSGDIGGPGSNPGQFEFIGNIAVDALGFVYVFDESVGGRKIQKYYRDGSFMGEWNPVLTQSGFSHHMNIGLAIDGSGNLYSLDLYHSQQMYKTYMNVFTHTGLYLRSWLVYNQWSAYNISTDGGGNVYISNTTQHNVLKFNSLGTLITSWGTVGTQNGEFQYPIGIAVDSDCNTFVVDNQNNRVQKFELSSPSRKSLIPVSADNGSKVYAYPNPGNGEFTIYAPGKTTYELVLYNALGQEVFRETSKGENFEVTDPSLTEGIYILHVIDGNETEKLKLVITK